MKISKMVMQQKKFIMSYYVVEKLFKITKVTTYNDEVMYDDYNLVHEGSYVKKWSMVFSNERELRNELKKWYVRPTLFYGSLISALRYNNSKEFVIIKEQGSIDCADYLFSIGKKKKKNKFSKKRNHVNYCDCYHCTGMLYDKYQKTFEKDEKIINGL